MIEKEVHMDNFDFDKRLKSLTETRDRNNEIKRLRWVEGWTLQRIANLYGLTRARIQQIVGKREGK